MSERVLTTGEPVPEDGSHTRLLPNGQQAGYVVLSEAERAKGFVKPVRDCYVHNGPPPAPDNLRDLTDEERRFYGEEFAKYQPYSPGGSAVGRFWTQAEIDRAGKHCGAVTTMGLALAETYARDPRFYSGTFCIRCQTHFPLSEFVWRDGEPMDPSLQEAWHASKAERDAAELAAQHRRLIATLQKEHREAREKLAKMGVTEWIEIDPAKPPSGEVIVLIEGGWVTAADFAAGGWWRNGKMLSSTPTHYQPMPAPPSKKP